MIMIPANHAEKDQIESSAAIRREIYPLVALGNSKFDYLSPKYLS